MQFSKLDMIEQHQALDHDAWKWMMDYCLTHRLPPAQQWAWDKAKEAFQKKQGLSNHLTDDDCDN